MNKAFVRAALITSPFMAIYNVIPVILITYPFREELLQERINEPWRLLLALSIIGLSVFVLWLLNIYLEKFSIEAIWKVCISYLAAIGLVLLIRFLRGHSENELMNIPVLYPIFSILTNNTFIIWIIRSLKVQNEKHTLTSLKSQLELENNYIKQNALKNQIHPHFLFNTIANLNELIKSDAALAEKFSLDLAAFLRLSIEFSQKDTVTIAQELNLLNIYI